MAKERISIIVPCYNEQDNIEDMYERVVAVFAKLKSYDFEIVYIDNHSLDNSVPIFQKLAKKDKRVKVILMSRNFGSPQPSFLAGMAAASGDSCVLLHGDIQDPPELIPTLLTHWKEGYDVVYGVRTTRKGYGFWWNFYYKAFYFLLKKLAYISIPLNAGEFSLMSRRVMESLLSIPEYDYNVRCLRAFVGFPQLGFPYVREARHKGKSTESFLSGVMWAKAIIFNFSFKPLTWISFLGFMVTISSVLFFFFYCGLLIIDKHRAPGIPTVLFIVLFLGGVQLLCISVIAEYIAKIFLEVKNRPRYIADKTYNMDQEAEKRLTSHARLHH